MANGVTSKEEYVQLFNEIVQQQSVVLGPDIATIIAKKVEGLTFSDDRKVTNYAGNPQQILETLINGYVNLSGMIVRKTIEPLLTKHLNKETQAPQQPAGQPVAQQPQSPAQSQKPQPPTTEQPKPEAQPAPSVEQPKPVQQPQSAQPQPQPAQTQQESTQEGS